jgi:hypothetical protein
VALIRTLSAGHPLVVDAPVSNDLRFVVRYERSQPYYLHLGSSNYRASESTRQCPDRRWSLRTSTLVFRTRPLPTILSLESSFPNGYYVRRQALYNFYHGDQTGARLRIRRRAGLPYATLEIRRHPESNTAKMTLAPLNATWRVWFAEVPPGRSFGSMTAAAVCFMSVWIVGVAVSHSDLGNSAPAFLLAFPAAAAGWLAFEPPTRRLSEGSLIARTSLLCTLALSLIGTALYTLPQQSPIALSLGGIGLLGITKPGWVILAGLSLVNMITMMWNCVRDAWEYMSLSIEMEDPSISLRDEKR